MALTRLLHCMQAAEVPKYLHTIQLPVRTQVVIIYNRAYLTLSTLGVKKEVGTVNITSSVHLLEDRQGRWNDKPSTLLLKLASSNAWLGDPASVPR